MNRLGKILGLLALCVLVAAPASAQGLIMARSNQMFPESMTLLQAAIARRGYTITRLQQVNENLAKMHYPSDVYRVVFFGKYDEIKAITAKHPDLIPYLPLSITIFAEDNQAILVAIHPLTFAEYFPYQELKPVFEQWENDLVQIMDEMRETK
ncbi:MAG: DUF302 domain-containing protein [Pseudomonadota bacterium]